MHPKYCGSCWHRNASTKGDTAAVTKPCRKCWQAKKPKTEKIPEVREYVERAESRP